MLFSKATFVEHWVFRLAEALENNIAISKKCLQSVQDCPAKCKAAGALFRPLQLHQHLHGNHLRNGGALIMNMSSGAWLLRKNLLQGQPIFEIDQLLTEHSPSIVTNKEQTQTSRTTKSKMQALSGASLFGATRPFCRLEAWAQSFGTYSKLNSAVILCPICVSRLCAFVAQGIPLTRQNLRRKLGILEAWSYKELCTYADRAVYMKQSPVNKKKACKAYVDP